MRVLPRQGADGIVSGGDSTLLRMDANLVALRDFRDNFYTCLYRRVDVLFELAYALLSAESARLSSWLSHKV